MGSSAVTTKLLVYSGVPVVVVGGIVSRSEAEELGWVVSRLVKAGHCSLLFDLSDAALADTGALEAFEEIADQVTDRYGRLAIIGSEAVIKAIRGRPSLCRKVRLCRSREHAVSQIMRRQYLPLVGAVETTAKLSH